jgi:peroxiredoxin
MSIKVRPLPAAAGDDATQRGALRRGLLFAFGGAAAAAAAGIGGARLLAACPAWLSLACGRSRRAAATPAAVPAASEFAPAPAAPASDPFAGGQARGGAEAPGARGAASGPAAPDFTVTTTNGQRFTLSAHRGRPVLLLFTADWCTSCIAEVQKLARLHAEEGPKGLVIAALDVDPTETAADFLRLRRLAGGGDFVWALDTGQQATRAYGIRATDTKVLIDPAGRITWQAVGPTPMETLREQVRRAFGGTP